jgi:hypothetical protein
MYNPVTIMPDANPLALISLVVSGVALGVSGLTLYRAHLEKAKVRVYTGSSIWLVSNKKGQVVGAQIPCTFVNEGARPGTSATPGA